MGDEVGECGRWCRSLVPAVSPRPALRGGTAGGWGSEWLGLLVAGFGGLE